MLGKTANGLFWMFRYIERGENTIRLVEAGLRMALTRSSNSTEEWESILNTAGGRTAYFEFYDRLEPGQVVDFLLRDQRNPSSVLSCLNKARTNARLVRTALTREVWEAVNDCWITVNEMLSRPVRERELPNLIASMRNKDSLIRGALIGTMLRNDQFNFCRLGTFLERADNTARILDVKYYVLLPSVSHVGSSLDNVQWEIILRCVSAHRSYRWVYEAEYRPLNIADFLIFNPRLPRSLMFCYVKISDNLAHLAREYHARHACHDLAVSLRERLSSNSTQALFDQGLHEFLTDFIRDNDQLGVLIDQAYRFTE